MQRVAQASQDAPGSTTEVFRREMTALGWEERLNNLYRVKDKFDGKFKFFRPNSSQRKFLGSKQKRDIILKARQFGFTTLACLYAYDRALWDGWSTGIMSHIQKQTEKIFDIVKNANDWFVKDWGHLWKPEQENNNTYRISWKESKASITVAFDFRSLTVQFLHVSEAAFIETDRLTSSLQSVPEHGEIIEESTPNGTGGVFYNHWQAWKKTGQGAAYHGHFFPWFDHYPENPELWKERAKYLTQATDRERELQEAYHLEPYHLAWRRWIIAASCNGDEDVFEREYPSNDRDCFLSGEAQVYSTSCLKFQQRFVRDPAHVGFLKVEGKRVSFYDDPKGLLKIWELPQPEAEYVIGADASEGIGKDAAAAIVIKRETGEMVAQLRGQIPPGVFAEELWRLGNFYNLCFVNPEANHHGHMVIEELVRRGYGKIYKRYTLDEITNKPTTKLGFLTTVGSKIPLTEAHVTACREGKFKCLSEDLFFEMNNFIQLSSKSGRSFRRQARDDMHDDTLMAACLAWEMHKKLGSEYRGESTTLPDDFRKAVVDPDTGCFTNLPDLTDPESTTEGSFDEFTGHAV